MDVVASAPSAIPGANVSGDGSIEYNAEQVIATRRGSVLASKTILKEDHFPGCQNMKLRPLVDGAPNFRQVEGLPVYGVAIPTEAGLRNVLTLIGGKYRRAIWHNMREEPLVYINGNPYVLREVERPFMNLEHSGISRERVEQMENRLKKDVLAEATRYGNRVLVNKETDDGKVEDVWESVGEGSVLTPKQVFERLKAEGFDVEAIRVPVTDEKAPKVQDFDELAANCAAAAEEGTALLFNCQMGRGRTTTAMVVASLVHLRLNPRTLPLPPLTRPPQPGAGAHPGDDALLRGEYGVVRSLLRVLDAGNAAKEQVIDRCEHMQNLREAILSYRRAIAREADDRKREAALQRGAEYLERYFVLIAFGAYVQGDSFGQPGGSFQTWMAERPELHSIARRMLWRNPMSALAAPAPAPEAAPSPDRPLQSRSSRLGSLGSLGGSVGSLSLQAAEDLADTVISSRSGAVLGKHTILKEEPYPGIHSPEMPVLVEGAANFRQAPGYPVYGLAISPVAAVRRVLERVGAGPGGACVAVWHNMREEPTVYINGTPYVLREAERPLGNMLEYSGIDVRRLEEMEARLAQDVLAEFAQYGRALFTREQDDGQLVDVWVHAEGAAVQTPREVYEALAEREGYRVRYLRVPVTHTRAPKSRNFAALTESIQGAEDGAQLIFSCQAGHGRTTTAMVIAALLVRARRVTQGLPPVAPDAPGGTPAGRGAAAHGGGGGAGAGAGGVVSREALRRGEWPVVRRLLRLLQAGEAAKDELDDAIDGCSALVNLREGILEGTQNLLRREAAAAGETPQQATMSHDKMQYEALTRGVEWLDRYVVMILYAAWVKKGCPGTFKEWKAARPEVKALRQEVFANPLAALEYSRPLQELLPGAAGLAGAAGAGSAGGGAGAPADGDGPAAAAGAPQGGKLSEEEAAAIRLVAARSGSILAARTILKAHYLRPGSQQQPGGGGGGGGGGAGGADATPERLVPNFSSARTPGQAAASVCGMGTPSLPALRALLEHFGAAPNDDVLDEEDAATGRSVVLTDMREELGLYVGGEFFLLRELAAPVVSLKNIGIEGPRVEALERQLKREVLAEAARSGGRLLLHREAVDEGDACAQSWQVGAGDGRGQPAAVLPFFLPVDAASVLTVREAADQLAAEGFRLSYRRVPMTRARPAGREGAGDLDLLRQQVEAAQAPAATTFVFMSQTGRGSAGYAMAAACSVLATAAGADSPLADGTPRKPPRGAAPEPLVASSPELRVLAEKTGESRDVLALMRVLRDGPASKEMADWALAACVDAGDLRKDIAVCRARAQDASITTVDRTAAAALGLNYLRRYQLLVAFCSFCFSHPLGNSEDDTGGAGGEGPRFQAWISERPEVLVLLKRTKL